MTISFSARMQTRAHRLRRISVATSFVIVGFFLVGAVCADLSPHDPFRSNILERHQAPSRQHWAGTDALGRDVFTRTLYGGGISLFVGISVAIVATFLGVTIGVIAGFMGGLFDSTLMRMTDLFLSVPPIFLLILISTIYQDLFLATSVRGEGLVVVFSISLIAWMPLARLLRSYTRSLKYQGFITASVALGAGNLRIISRHILPNTIHVIIVALTLQIADAILMEAFLSFIGFGIHPRTPTWGNMLSNGQGLYNYPWEILFPATTLVITVMAIHNLGDWLTKKLLAG